MKKISWTQATLLIASVAFLIGTVACGSGGGGGSSVAPVNPYGIGGGVISNPVAFYNNIPSSSAYGDFMMNMAMYVQSGYQQGVGGSTPVAFQGQLIITDGMYCNAPPGTYSLTTTTAGTLSGTSIGPGPQGPMTLIAVGPTTIQMSVNYGIIENAGQRVALNMYLYVNGSYCPPYLQTL